MKKVVIWICCFLVLFSSCFSKVYAEELDDLYDDTQYYGTFFGEEYPIISSNPDIMPLYDVSGFSITNMYMNDSGTYVNYNQAVTLPNTNSRTFYIEALLPSEIERGQSVDVNLSLLFNGASVTYSQIYVFDSLWHSSRPDVSVSLANNSSSSYSATFNNIVSSDFTIKRIRFYFTVKPTTTNFSFYVSGISVTKASDSALLGQLSAQMEMLIYLVQNNIVGSLTSLLQAWTTYLDVLPVWLEEHCTHIRNTLQSMSDTLDSSILGVKSAVTTIGSNIVSSITSMNNNLASKIETMQNAIVTKLDDTLVVKDKTDINNTNKSNSDLENGFNDYNDIENGMVNDFNTSMDNIDTDMKLYSDNDFIASAQFVSTNLQNIYDSNIYIAYVVDFALIMGIALTLIGIKVRR